MQSNQTKVMRCPSCERNGRFTFIGEQRWPIQVAAKLGLPSIIKMYTCPTCGTTISDPDAPRSAERSSGAEYNAPTAHV